MNYIDLFLLEHARKLTSSSIIMYDKVDDYYILMLFDPLENTIIFAVFWWRHKHTRRVLYDAILILFKHFNMFLKSWKYEKNFDNPFWSFSIVFFLTRGHFNQGLIRDMNHPTPPGRKSYRCKGFIRKITITN